MAIDESITASAAWRRLQQGLIEAKGKGDSLATARAALEAVCEFIQAVDPVHGRFLATPLTVLNIALGSRGKGADPLILRLAEWGRGRRPDALGREYIRAYAAAAMTNLMEMGSHREAAGKAVADTLNMCRVTRSGGHEVTWSTVASWRDHLERATSGDKTAKLYREVLAERKQRTHLMWQGAKRGEATPHQYVLAQLMTVIINVGGA